MQILVYQINRQLKKKALLACCFALSTLSLKAQTWELGGSVAGAGYQGDLDQRNLVKPSGAAVGAFLQRNINPYLSVKLNYTYGKIQAADSTSKTEQFRERNLSFVTRLSEISLMGEFNFMKYTPGADFNHFTPYIFLGGGINFFNPQANYQGITYDLRPRQTEGEAKYAYTTLVIPYGAGIKYNFTSSWNIMLNAGYRYARTDYLDDVSGLYIDKSKAVSTLAAALSDRSGERNGVYIGTPGTQRGDLRSHDTYFFIGFTLSFTFLTTNCYY